jgi:hypothetical protein
MRNDNKLNAVCPIYEREVEAILVEEWERGYRMLRCPFCFNSLTKKLTFNKRKIHCEVRTE